MAGDGEWTSETPDLRMENNREKLVGFSRFPCSGDYPQLSRTFVAADGILPLSRVDVKGRQMCHGLLATHEQGNREICKHFCQRQNHLAVSFGGIVRFAGEHVAQTLVRLNSWQDKEVILPNLWPERQIALVGHQTGQ